MDNQLSDFVFNARIQTRRSLLESVRQYLVTQEDSDKWKDFFESSTGKIFLNTLTGLTELLLFKVESRAKESYLYSARTQSAVFLLAQAMGYNPNRRKHSTGYLTATIHPYAQATFTIPKHMQIYGEVPVVTTDNILVDVKSKTVENIPVMQGYWKEVYIASSEELINQHYNINEEIETEVRTDYVGKQWETIYLQEKNFEIDQFELYVEVDGEPVTVVDKVQTFKISDENIGFIDSLETAEEKVEFIKSNTSLILDENFLMLADSNSVLARTDYEGGVFLLFGDGSFGKLLQSHNAIKIKYLVTIGKDGYLPVNTDFGTYDIASEFVSFRTSSLLVGGTNEDSIEKIKHVAPRFFYTQGRAVTRYDYETIAMSYPGIVSAQVNRIEECCTICLSALKQEGIEWNETEIDAFLEYMDQYKMVSTKIDFWEPEGIPLDLEVLVVLRNDSIISDVKSNLDVIINNNCYLLGQTFRSTKLLDDLVDSHSSIVRCYLNSVNGQDNYPDIDLACYGFFEPGDIRVSYQVE